MMTQQVHKIKEDYPLYKFYYVGSIMRNNPKPNDLDIGIIPNKGKAKLQEWESILKRFHEITDFPLRIDAQIVPAYRKLFNLSGHEVKTIMNDSLFRYVYHTETPSAKYAIYTRACGNLWRKKVKVVSEKYRNKGLIGFEFNHEEI